MPRNGSGIYSYPPGTPGVPDTPVESVPYNTYIADIEFDLNLPRPIVAGGTGASNPAQALTNLGAVAKAGDTMTGGLTISSPTSALQLNTSAGQHLTLNYDSATGVPYQKINLKNNNVQRWTIMGFGTESGSDTGNDLFFIPASDAGADKAAAFQINRNTGYGIFHQALGVGVTPAADELFSAYTTVASKWAGAFRCIPASGTAKGLLVVAGSVDGDTALYVANPALVPLFSVSGRGDAVHTIGESGSFTIKAASNFSNTSVPIVQWLDKDSAQRFYIQYSAPNSRVELWSTTGNNILFGSPSGLIMLSGTNVNWVTTSCDFKLPVRIDAVGDAGYAPVPGALHVRANGSTNYGSVFHHQLHASYSAVFYTAGPLVGSISHGSGTTTAYNTSSDGRLKSFSGEYDPLKAIDIIKRDPVKSFTWRSTGEEAVGWSAQASYEVDKNFATPPPDEFRATKPGDENFFPWGMDLAKRTPYLWAALTGAWDRIDALEARVAALEL